MRIVKVWSIIILLTGLVALTGCPGDDGGSAVAPPIVPTGGVCPTGYYVSSNGVCLVDNTGTQWATQLVWGNYLSISDASQYRKFLLEYAALCDRNDGTIFEFMDFWQNSCKTWDDKAYVSVQLAHNEIAPEGTAGTVRIFAYNDMSYGSSDYAPLLPINGNFLNINNDGGFELRQVGGNFYSYNKEISVRILGRPADSALALVLYYDGAEFARASIYNQQQ